jgi:fructose-specific phosphotransferase system component IIB
MSVENLKNIVVFKNLPSNIVEEAIIILKTNKKVKNVQYTEKCIRNKTENDIKNPKEYIVKEAESIISNCVSNIENSNNKKQKNYIELEKKYKKIKYLAIILTGLLILNFMIK